MGDDVHTGIGSLINVGTVIGAGAHIGPGVLVNGEVQAQKKKSVIKSPCSSLPDDGLDGRVKK
jgi:acetyltransferase-like isoleucine patch superfamily enzyme